MRARTPVVLTMLLSLLIALGSCSKDKAESEPGSEALTRAEALQTMATPSLDSIGAGTGSTASGKALPRMIDFGRGKCIPCKKMEPILRELRQAYAGRATIEMVSLDEEPHAIDSFNLRLIPTQIFFDSTGTEVWRHEGFLSRGAIVARLAEMGVEPVDD